MGTTMTSDDTARSAKRLVWWDRPVEGLPHPHLTSRVRMDQTIYAVRQTRHGEERIFWRLYMWWGDRLCRIDHLIGTDIRKELNLGFDECLGVYYAGEAEWVTAQHVVSAVGHKVLTHESEWQAVLL